MIKISIAVFLYFFSLSVLAEQNFFTPELKWFVDSFNYIVFPLIGITFVLLGIRGLIGRNPELNCTFIKPIERILASIVFIILGFLVIPVLFGDSIWNSFPARIIYLLAAFMIFYLFMNGKNLDKNLNLGEYHLLQFRESSERLDIITIPSMATYLNFWISSTALWTFGTLVIASTGVHMEIIIRAIITRDSIIESVILAAGSFGHSIGYSLIFMLGLLLVLASIAWLFIGISKLFIKTACVFDKRKNTFCFYRQRYKPSRVCHKIDEIKSFQILTKIASRSVHGDYLNKKLYPTTRGQCYYLHVQLISGGSPALIQIPFFDPEELEVVEKRIKRFIDWNNMTFLSISKK